MQCPLDNTTLVVTERSGIEIEYCPTCRGIWLDHGELDKIIERSNTQMAKTSKKEDSEDSDQQGGGRDKRKKKKGSFIGDIFGGL